MPPKAAAATWEGDSAYVGCKAWVDGWREANGPDNALPSLTVARQVGRDAIALMGQYVSRVEIARIMWAAGCDGKPLDIQAPPSTEEEQP